MFCRFKHIINHTQRVFLYINLLHRFLTEGTTPHEVGTYATSTACLPIDK